MNHFVFHFWNFITETKYKFGKYLDYLFLQTIIRVSMTEADISFDIAASFCSLCFSMICSAYGSNEATVEHIYAFIYSLQQSCLV